MGDSINVHEGWSASDSAEMLALMKKQADPKTYYSPEAFATLKESFDKKYPSTTKKNPAPMSVAEYSDYLNLSQTLDSVELSAIDHVAAKMAEAMGVSLDALIKGTADPTPPPVIHRQTVLFQDDRPRENWAYGVEIKIIKTEYVPGTDWEILQFKKGIHRTKVRALWYLDCLLGSNPKYANPERFQWRVRPYYVGCTWRERIENLLKTRQKIQAIKAAARDDAKRNLELEVERRAIQKNGGYFNKLHLFPNPQPNPLSVYPVVTPLKPLISSGAGSGEAFAAGYGGVFGDIPPGQVWNFKYEVDPSGKPILVPLTPSTPASWEGLFVPQPEPHIKTATGAALATAGSVKMYGMDELKYVVQKMNEMAVDALQYAVQPAFVIHPKTYEALAAEGLADSP